MSKRCNCRASSTSLICKNNYSFIINNKKYCFIHAKMLFNTYALHIQRIWYGQKIRLKLKNIYYKLPYDLQRKVLFYVRENYLIEKHHHTIIRNILSKKVDKILSIEKVENQPRLIKLDEYNYTSYVYYLYNKYNTITSLDKIWYLKNRIFVLKYFNTEFVARISDIKEQEKYAQCISKMRENVIIFENRHCYMY
jgi:hypothetical protein